jgi:membrane protein YdbS with pleckstrin-like domain
MTEAATDRFAAETGIIVCHGGIALEEVIVPYVRVTRK